MIRRTFDGVQLYRGRGCERCKNSGYAGRMAIIEAMTISDQIRKLIIARANTREIGKVAIKPGNAHAPHGRARPRARRYFHFGTGLRDDLGTLIRAGCSKFSLRNHEWLRRLSTSTAASAVSKPARLPAARRLGR